MPNLPFNPNDRRVIVSILVLLLAIVILNWRVFQPLRSRPAREDVIHDESVYVPEDLDGMKGVATRRLTGGMGADGTALAGAGGGGTGVRDPFRKASDPAPRVTKVSKRSTEQQESAPVCTAVLLGGEQPAALINGKVYHQGDQVAGYRIERVERSGVRLVGKNGHLVLPVGGPAKNEAHHAPVRAGAKRR